MSAAELCCPGMIDTHVHAPQYQFTGTATDLPLME
jgi:guanine deaminase